MGEMIAVGLWGAQLGASAVWLLPVTFPLIKLPFVTISSA